MQLPQRFRLRPGIVKGKLRHVGLHLQRGQRAAQLMGGIRGEAALAGHHLLRTGEKMVKRIKQRANLRRHAVGGQRIGRIRRARAQGLRQFFQRFQFPAQQNNQQQ